MADQQVCGLANRRLSLSASLSGTCPAANHLFEVDPFSRTPHPYGRRIPTCQSRSPRIRRSSADRWSSYCRLGARRRSLRVSSTAAPSEVAMSPFQTPDRPQIFFYVEDMTSSRSVDAVIGALMELDDRATVRIDLPMRRVEIDPTSAEPAAFKEAISNAGYSSVRRWPSESAYF
jgi:copper chaperone CopZ